MADLRLEYIGVSSLLGRVAKHVPLDSEDRDPIERAMLDAARKTAMNLIAHRDGSFSLEPANSGGLFKTLPPPDPWTRTQKGGQETSREAVEKIIPKMSKLRKAVLVTLARGPMSDELLRTYHPQYRESTIRTRRSELVQMGLVEDSRERVKLASGNRSIIWQLTEAGRKEAIEHG